MKRVNVIVVTDVPQLAHPAIQGGIRSKEEAAAWGEKNGFASVYLFARRERVYADRLAQRVDVQAKRIERKSAALVDLSERGAALAEWLLLLAFVLVLFIGLKDVPW